MPIQVNIKSNILSDITNNDLIQVTIVDYLINPNIYNQKVMKQLIKLYPHHEDIIKEIFNSKIIKYRNIIKNDNNSIIQCDVFIL
jgi:hypothetical protein